MNAPFKYAHAADADTIVADNGNIVRIVGINGVQITSTKELNSELIRGADRSSIVLSVARGRYVYNLTFPMSL